MKYQPNHKAYGPAIPRLDDVMAHIPKYSIEGVTRLAKDAGVSVSSVSRIINGLQSPSFIIIARLAGAIEHQLGVRVDPRDIVAESGRFLTPHACDVACCKGCLPHSALDELGQRRKSFEGVKPGQWVASRFPKGFRPGEEIHAN